MGLGFGIRVWLDTSTGKVRHGKWYGMQYDTLWHSYIVRMAWHGIHMVHFLTMVNYDVVRSGMAQKIVSCGTGMPLNMNPRWN